MGVLSNLSNLFALVIARTPVVLRPLWVVIIIVGGMLVAQLAAIAIYRIGGESRTVNLALIGYFGAFGSIAALAFGISSLFVPRTSRLRPWVLGFFTSAAFWVSGALFVPPAVQSASDLLALCVLVLITTWLVGILLPKTAQHDSDV